MEIIKITEEELLQLGVPPHLLTHTMGMLAYQIKEGRIQNNKQAIEKFIQFLPGMAKTIMEQNEEK